MTGHERLLANRPVLSRAVTLRDPYVDALSYLQLRAPAGCRPGLGPGGGVAAAKDAVQEGEHAFQEELTWVCIEIELVLVP